MSEATSPHFHTHQLSNGLQIVGQSLLDFESVALCFYVRTGARDEEESREAGISHFLEHMIFKGTKGLILIEESNIFTIGPIVLRDRSGDLFEKIEYL